MIYSDPGAQSLVLIHVRTPTVQKLLQMRIQTQDLFSISLIISFVFIPHHPCMQYVHVHYF